MRDYELAIILQPTLESEAVTAAIEQVSQYVKNQQGTVAGVEVWGKRKMAYPIGRYSEGVYAILRVSLAPNTNTELERELRLMETVIRYLLVKIET